MSTEAEADAVRGRLNLKPLRVEAAAMLEHAPPDHVVSQMLLAAAEVAIGAGMPAEDFIRCFGVVLSVVSDVGVDLRIEVGWTGAADDQ